MKRYLLKHDAVCPICKLPLDVWIDHGSNLPPTRNIVIPTRIMVRCVRGKLSLAEESPVKIGDVDATCEVVTSCGEVSLYFREKGEFSEIRTILGRYPWIFEACIMRAIK
jgi:hypothetical protein